MLRRLTPFPGAAKAGLAWALMAVVPLVFLARGGKAVDPWSLAAALHLAAVFFWINHPRVKELVRHPVFPGVAGALIWHTLAWVFSDAPALGFLAVGKIWVLAAFAAGAWVLWGRSQFRVFENLVLLLAGLQTAAVFLAGFFDKAPPLLFPGNPHYGALWLAAASLLALQRFAERRRERHPAVLIWPAAAAAYAAALYLLNVRSILAGYAAGLVVFLALAAGRRVLLGALLAAALGAALLPSDVWRRTLKLDDALAWRRGDIWTAAARGIVEKPVFGWGPGHFETLYRRHGLAQQDLTVRHELSTGFAHNDFLQAAADAGLPALFFWLFALGGFLWSKPSGNSAPAVLGTLAVWAVASLFYFPFALPVNGFLLAGLAASLEPTRRFAVSPSGPWAGKAARALAWGGAAVFAAGFVVLGAASLAHRFGGPLAVWDPRWPENTLHRAGQLIHGAAAVAPEEARALVRPVLRFYPNWAEGWHFLGHLAADHTNPVEARAAYENFARAVALRPHHAPWRREWAGFAERAGRLEDARRLLRETLILEPAYADAVLASARVSRLQGRARRGERILRRFLARRDPQAVAGPGASPYRAAVLDWRPEEFALELARCQLDQNLFRDALATLAPVPAGPPRAELESRARRGLRRGA